MKDVPAERIEEVVARRARERPEAVAVVDGPVATTYRELDAWSDVVAARVVAAGIGPGDLVGVHLQRGTAMVATLLGVLKVGGGYLMLDPAWPVARLRTLVRDGRVAAVVHHPTSPAPVALDVRLVPAPDPGEPSAAFAHPPAGQGGVDSVACVMFTSGSTGTPKGVVAPHRAIVDTLMGQDYADFGPGAVWLQVAPMSWDAFVLELWGPLLGGGTCVLHPATRVDPGELAQLVVAAGVTSLYLSSSLFTVLVDEYPQALDGIDRLVVGGEALSPGHVRHLLARRPDLRIRNGYGPVETMIFQTTHAVTAAEAAHPSIPIGTPLRGKQVLVLDDHLHRVPDGDEGELYAVGSGLAHGYLHLPAATAQRFVANPYGAPGERMYRTGDRGVRRRDGVFEFRGRVDDQVKIRGFRVEPGEVAAALAGCAAVRRVAVTTEPAPGGTGRQLVAVLVGHRDVPDVERRVREHVAAALPEHLRPTRYVVCDELPLTATGKLDRAAVAGTAVPARSGRAPVDDAERLLCELVADLLGRPQVDADADFFALGGDSLLAARLTARVHARCGASLGVADVFAAPGLAELATRLRSAPTRSAPPPVVRPGPVPASHAQRRLWVLDAVGAGAAYQLPIVIHLDGAVAVDALARAVRAVLHRHESLRTVLHQVGDELVQRVLPADGARQRLRAQPVLAADLDRTVARIAYLPFDLATDPPFDPVLLSITDRPDQHLLLLRLHHVAADGWSLVPLLRDLGDAYAGRALPAPRLPHAEHAVREQARLGDPRTPGSLARRQLDHWRATLAGMPPQLALPRRLDAPPVPRPGVATVTRHLDAAGHRRLVAVGHRHGATLFMLLHAALAVALARAGCGRDLPIGTPVAGRAGDGDAIDVVGFFVNFLVLRTVLGEDPTVGELLAGVRETDLAAFAHQDVPFESVVAELAPARVPGRNPFTDVVLVLQNNTAPDLQLTGVSTQIEVLRPAAARFDLLLEATDAHGPGRRPDGVAFVLEYRTDSFARSTADGLLDDLLAVLDGLAGAAPDTPVRAVGRPTSSVITAPSTAAVSTVSRDEGAPSPPGLRHRIAAILADVLGCDAVADDADFFRMGGNSLLAVRAAARLDHAGIPVTAVQIFATPTVAALAEAVAVAPTRVPAAPIPARPRRRSGARPA